MRLLLLSTLMALSCASVQADDYKILCYYSSWAVYRPGAGQMNVEDIDPHACTHLLYSFAGLNNETHKIYSLDPWNDLPPDEGGQNGAYKRFTGLKKNNTELKTLLALGGWNEGSETFSKMAMTAETRKIFIGSVVEFLTKYNFDGLEMDWEYPTQRNGTAADKVNYESLLKETKAAFQPHGLILTASVAAGVPIIEAAYNATLMAQNLDYVNLMSYDLHGSWETFTGNGAPLFKSHLDHGINEQLNVDFVVSKWLQLGMPPRQIMMGVPLYGHSFTLADPAVHGLYAPAPAPGAPCPYMRVKGWCGYMEICEKFRDETGWTVTYDPEQKTPYTYKDDFWVGYDDVQSLTAKMQYIKDKGLGGAMVWSVETDDFRGECKGGVKNPLLGAIKSGLTASPAKP